MNLCCPTCGFKASIEVFAGDKAARHVAALMGRVPPPLSDLLLRYLGLFAPAKHAMTFSRMQTLLQELVPMIEAGRITRAKREWPVNLAQWEHGMQQMVEKRAQLTLPLKSHGYLLTILAGDADKLEAQAENEDIKRDRSGESRKTDAATSEAGQWDADRAAQRAQLSAVQALSMEVGSCKRLGVPMTRAALEVQLLKGGHTPKAIEFAFSKLAEPIA